MPKSIDPNTPTGRMLLGKTTRLINGLEEGIGLLGDQRAATVFEPAGRACAGDLKALFSEILGRPPQSVDDLTEAWNQLRAKRGLEGSWVRQGDTVSVILPQCSCPLVAGGLVELRAEHCLCSQAMLKVIFSEMAGGAVQVELPRAIGRGDEVCELVVTGV